MDNKSAIKIMNRKKSETLLKTQFKLQSILNETNGNLNSVDMTVEDIESINKLKANIDDITKMITINDITTGYEWDLDSNFTGVKVKQLKIGNDYIDVTSYASCISKFCSYLINNNKEKFNRTILKSNLGRYFSNESTTFTSYTKIDGSDLYVNTGMNAISASRFIKRVNEYYGLELNVKLVINDDNLNN